MTTQQFWMVYGDGQIAPTFRYKTLEDARA